MAAAPAVPTPAALNPDTTADPSATMRPLSSTDPGHDAATALEAGRCRPGDPAACSFNRRDWVVLLKQTADAVSQALGYINLKK